jgi:hypothetical protein
MISSILNSKGKHRKYDYMASFSKENMRKAISDL